jgi:CBS domain-containing protein
MKKRSIYIKGRPYRLTLDADTAAGLMNPGVQSIPETMTAKEAAGFLTTHGFSAAPVVNELGDPVGVLSRSDLVRHDYEKVEHVHEPAEPPSRASRDRMVTQWGERLPQGYHVEEDGGIAVRELMTPVIYSVEPRTPATTVIDAMLSLGVHRLFVTDTDGGVIGVISALDVLRHLCK